MGSGEGGGWVGGRGQVWTVTPPRNECMGVSVLGKYHFLHTNYKDFLNT